MTIILDESEIKSIEKKILDDISLYIRRTIKEEIKKTLLAKRKEWHKNQLSFI